MITPARLRRAFLAGGIGLSLWIGNSPVAAAPSDAQHQHQAHVLLISVDGLHEFDLRQWTDQHPQSILAHLRAQGTFYTQAFTSQPSDSFPGLIAQVTGGTPRSTGIFYDDSYGRTLWAPGSNCMGEPGTETQYAENIDTTVNSAIPLFNPNPPTNPSIPNPLIDPSQLPMGIVHGTCVPIYPHSFLQTNTIFNVAHDAGLYTAWSDKHPAYEIVRGPSNTGAEDLFTPEINNANDPTATSVKATEAYDQLKVNAILNEINGETSLGGTPAGGPTVPAIFGMNFQSVSVAEKLVGNYSQPGGYEPGTLAFTPQMEDALSYVDGSIGSMVNELRSRGLLDSTELIISAKHGQSPINPVLLQKIGDPISTILGNAGVRIAQATEDDVALLWLKDQAQTGVAVAALEADQRGANTAHIQTILTGDALVDQFGDPRHDRSTPDIIVQPIKGTIYTHSTTKVAEHGGFTDDDRHVGLLVVRGSDADQQDGRTIDQRVETRQIAPTILKFLGLDPNRLDAVRQEGTQPLPGTTASR